MELKVCCHKQAFILISDYGPNAGPNSAFWVKAASRILMEYCRTLESSRSLINLAPGLALASPNRSIFFPAGAVLVRGCKVLSRDEMSEILSVCVKKAHQRLQRNQYLQRSARVVATLRIGQERTRWWGRTACPAVTADSK